LGYRKLGGEDILVLQVHLKEKHIPQKQRCRDKVSFPQASWFMQKSNEPFQIIIYPKLRWSMNSNGIKVKIAPIEQERGSIYFINAVITMPLSSGNSMSKKCNASLNTLPFFTTM